MPRGAVEGCFLVAGRRVEALEPRAPVVMAVRVVAVQDQVACDLDLVRRVVREVPGLARVAQTDLEQGRRDEQHRADDAPSSVIPAQRGHARRCQVTAAASATRRPARTAVERMIPRSHSRSATRTSGPRIPCGSTEGGRERPGVGAELRDRDRDDDAERRQQRPRTRRDRGHAPSMASLSARESTKLAATAIASHVTGSSKNPL